MHKKTILLAILLLTTILSSNVQAALTDNLLAYWKMENATGNITSEVNQKYQLTRINTPYLNTTGCINGNCTSVNNTGNSANTQAGFRSENLTGLSSTGISLAFWADFTSFTNGYWVFGIQEATTYHFGVQSTGTDAIKIVYPSASAGSNVYLNFNGTHHYVFIHQDAADTFLIYQDGVLKSNASTGGTGVVPPGNRFHLNGFDGAFSVNTMQLYDEIGLWNRSLTNAEINELYNSGTGLFYPFTMGGIPNVPTWVAPTPDDGKANNTQVTLNASCDPGQKYYMYFDSNNPPTTLVLINNSQGNYTTNVLIDDNYYYTAFCYNATTNIASSNSTVRTWIYDTAFPAISINGNNEYNTLNQTIQNAYDKSVVISFNASDNIALYAYSVNITKSGVVYYNVTNTTMSGTDATITHTLNVNSWPPGVYTSEIFVADAHTANNIGDYQVNPSKSKITFKTQTGNNIKIETDDQSDITAQKLIDRYTFTMSFDDGLTKTRTYHVKTDNCPLSKPAGTTYKGHLVSFCGKDGNWIDFEGVSGTVNTNKIDDYHYTVTITDNPPIVTFNSLGGLNTYNTTNTFFVGNYSYNNPSLIIGASQEMQLNLTLDTGWSSSAVFTYNTTTPTVTDNDPYYSATITQYTSGSVPFTWNATIYTGVYNYTFNISNTQTVQPIQLNFTYYDEDTLALVNTIVYLDLINTYYSRNLSGTAGVIKTNITDLNNPTLTLRYSVSGYTERTNIIELNSTATSWNIKLYLINTTLYQNVTVYVVDDFANPIEGVKVKALKYDITTNTYNLQETGLTNTAGSVLMTLTKYTEYYKFMVEQGTTLLKITNPGYITADSVTIQVVTGSSIGEEFFNYLGISGDLTFNTATDNFRLDYNDAGGIASQVCLNVYRGANTSKKLVTSTCSSSSSGTILIPVTSINGTSYYATAYYVEDGESKLLDSLSHTYPGLQTFGTYGLFLQTLLTIAVSFTAVVSPALAFVLIPASLWIGQLIGLNYFSTGMLAAIQILGIVFAIAFSFKKG